MMKTMMAPAAFALASGNVEAGNKTGTLVVYRPGGSGPTIQETFLLDGQPHNVGWFRRREFQLPAGQHTIAAEKIWTGVMQIQSVNIPAFAAVYVKCQIGLFPSLTLEVTNDQVQAGRCGVQTAE
jgi:hypothetical protein